MRLCWALWGALVAVLLPNVAHSEVDSSASLVLLSDGDTYSSKGLIKLNLGDDTTVPVALTTPFRYFGNTASFDVATAFVSSNGWVALSPTTSTTYNAYLMGVGSGESAKRSQHRSMVLHKLSPICTLDLAG
jgi:hypothetical protein